MAHPERPPLNNRFMERERERKGKRRGEGEEGERERGESNDLPL